MKWIYSLAIFAIGALIIVSVSLSLLPDGGQPFDEIPNGGWLDEHDLLVYLEAVTRIKERSVHLDRAANRQEIIQGTIKAFATDLDGFSDYLTAEELAEYRQSQNHQYVGIGMEIQKDRNGNIICFPYPGSPAEQAGIGLGDRITAIDGQSVNGKSLLTVASMARGQDRSAVILTVLKNGRRERQVSLERSAVSTDSVYSERHFDLPVIRIRSFAPDVKGKLKYQLETLDRDQPIILDLRSNAGGDLHSAIDAAMLFLAKGKKIVSIKYQDEVKTYESSNGPVRPNAPVFILQNEGTASAAEVFVAALTENNRAVSVGKKSFGKGTKQELIELSDGSALVLTTGYLLTPTGTGFNKEGLSPTFPLESSSPGTGQYIAKIRRLLGAD